MTTWKLVPVEPTPEMAAVFIPESCKTGSWIDGYKAMLASAPQPDVQPVAWLHVGGVYGEEPDEWELEAEQVLCDELNEKHINKPTALPLYPHPPAAAVQDLVAALMMIAGKQRCVDSLMSNVDIAVEALKRWEGLK